MPTHGRVLFAFLVAQAVEVLSGCSGGCLGVEYPEATSHESERVLLVVAHQDDDAFIVSRLQRHLEAGDSVFVIWTAVSSVPDTAYGMKRIAEAVRAMELLGVPRSHYRFLGYPDGETDLHICEITRRLRQSILLVRPTRVYVPAFEGGHIDHDVANAATSYALKAAHWSCRVEEFPIYNAFHFVPFLPFVFRNLPSSSPTRCRRLSTDEFRFVLDYWSLYQSQQFPLDDYLTLIPGHAAVFGWEYLRDLPAYDYLTEPDGGPVAYERFLAGVSFKDFQKAVRTAAMGCAGDDLQRDLPAAPTETAPEVSGLKPP